MEFEFIQWLRSTLPASNRLLVGPGDDAALVQMARSGDCLVTVDLLTDGVDFRLGDVDPRRIGYKALAVNLSDIAAMGGRPTAAVVALALPQQGGLELATQLYEGLLPLAERFDVAIAGGDTNSWPGRLVISVTLLGEPGPRGVLKRNGALPGDRIIVTGQFGGSILGKHLDFVPRIDEALWLAEHAEIHAAIDVSDGLSLDLSRVAKESRCGAIVALNDVPLSRAAHDYAASLADGSTPRDHALSDGEDFELILAVPPESAQRLLAEQPLEVPLTDIGEFIETPGLWISGPQGRVSLAARGFEHRLQ